MRYMLDTNICSYILKNRPLVVKEQFEKVGSGSVIVSTIVLAELYYGAARHSKGLVIRREIDDFVSRLDLVEWDHVAADHYGQIRSALEKAGNVIGGMDMLIAAHARSIGAVLVTNNTSEFSRVADLNVTNWIE